MSLTRKGLKAMGLTEEQVDSIIEAHTETVDGLKKQLETAKADADRLPGVQKELNELKAKGDDGYKQKYEDEHKAFDAYKKGIEAKESKTAKEAAARRFFESKKITGNSLEIAMRGSGAEIDAIEFDENGEIKNPKSLEDLVSGTFAGLVTKEIEVPGTTPTPPTGSGSAGLSTSRAAQIYNQHYKSLYGEAKGDNS